MLSFRNIFNNKHVILPVIHVSSFNQALRNVKISIDEGADGVFLINHEVHYKEMLEIHNSIHETYPNFWVGVNCLELEPEEIFDKINNNVSGVWVDNAMIEENYADQIRAENILLSKISSKWRGLYFGGVAFKYQKQVKNEEAVARIAKRYMDVITTSGKGTGFAADLEKIKKIRKGAGDHPIAIASGISPENVENYLDYADCFLVATGISISFNELDAGKLKQLIRNVRYQT